VVANGDRSRCAVVLADGPILVKRRRPIDRRLIDSLSAIKVVGRPIGGDGTDERSARARVVGTKGLDDVVLDERVTSPSVDGEVTVSVGPVVCSIGNGTRRVQVNKLVSVLLRSLIVLPCCTGIPSLSANKVTLIARPLDAVLATITVSVGNRACAISPERVIISSTVTGAAGCGASKDLAIVAGYSEHPCDDGRGSDDEGRETHCKAYV